MRLPEVRRADDMREAPSRLIIAELLRRGASIAAHDPKAMDEARRVLQAVSELSLVDTQAEVLDGSDALVIITDWKELKNPDFYAIKALLKQRVVIDGRNLYEPVLMQSLGIESIGTTAPFHGARNIRARASGLHHSLG